MTKLLTRAEVADLLQVPPKTLATWAYERRGPRYRQVGRHARYDERDLMAWLEQQPSGGEQIDPRSRGGGP